MAEDTCLRELGSLFIGYSTTFALVTPRSYIVVPRQHSFIPGSTSTSSSTSLSGSKKDKLQLQCRYCHRHGHVISEFYKKQHAKTFLCSQQRTPTAALMPDIARAATFDKIQSTLGASATFPVVDASFLKQLLQGSSLLSSMSTSRHSFTVYQAFASSNMPPPKALSYLDHASTTEHLWLLDYEASIHILIFLHLRLIFYLSHLFMFILLMAPLSCYSPRCFDYYIFIEMFLYTICFPHP